MGTSALTCPWIIENGIIAGTSGGTIGAGLNPTPDPPVSDPPPLEAVPEATDYESDAIVVLAILFEVLWLEDK